MAPTLMADRSVRDKSLAWAMALLFGSQLLRLIADSIHLTVSLESRVSDADKIADWLNLISHLPLLAAASFGLFAFITAGNERAWWLRRAFLAAALGFAIAFIASVFDYSAIESSPPEGMNLALLTACVATFALSAGFYLAVPAVSRTSDGEQGSRETKLRRSSRVLGIALLSTGLSSWAYALAYSTYSHSGVYTRGLIVQGFGAFAAGLSLLYAASAFGSGFTEEQDSLHQRERRLFLAACALGLSLVFVGIGDAQRAAGTTALGYLESSAVTSWIFALSRICEAAAFLCAARGFKVAAEPPG